MKKLLNMKKKEKPIRTPKEKPKNRNGSRSRKIKILPSKNFQSR